jgi:hypothetical protein
MMRCLALFYRFCHEADFMGFVCIKYVTFPYALLSLVRLLIHLICMAILWVLYFKYGILIRNTFTYIPKKQFQPGY